MNQKPKHNENTQPQETQDKPIIGSARQLILGMNEVNRAYVVLAVGLFLLLFSVGYFNFLRVAIGLIGMGLIVLGAIRSQLIAKATTWVNSMLKRS